MKTNEREIIEKLFAVLTEDGGDSLIHALMDLLDMDPVVTRQEIKNVATSFSAEWFDKATDDNGPLGKLADRFFSDDVQDATIIAVDLLFEKLGL